MAVVLVVTVRQHFHSVLITLSVGELGRDQASVSRRDLRRQIVGVRIAADGKVHWIVLTVWVLVESVPKVLLNDFMRVLCGKGLYTASAL